MREPLAPIAFVYMADIYCPSCARDDFGDALKDPDTVDGEGNPLGVVPPWSDAFTGNRCGSCGHTFT
jgi:hypothetical protein